MATKRTTKKKTAKWQYLSEQDPAQFVHSNKTHRSVSEAFKDAEYACSITRFKSDWERTREYIGWGAMWAVTLGTLYLFMTAFNSVV